MIEQGGREVIALIQTISFISQVEVERLCIIRAIDLAIIRPPILTT